MESQASEIVKKTANILNYHVPIKPNTLLIWQQGESLYCGIFHCTSNINLVKTKNKNFKKLNKD